MTSGAGEVGGGAGVDTLDVAGAEGMGLDGMSDAVQAETARAKRSARQSSGLEAIPQCAKSILNLLISEFLHV